MASSAPARSVLASQKLKNSECWPRRLTLRNRIQNQNMKRPNSANVPQMLRNLLAVISQVVEMISCEVGRWTGGAGIHDFWAFFSTYASYGLKGLGFRVSGQSWLPLLVTTVDLVFPKP